MGKILNQWHHAIPISLAALFIFGVAWADKPNNTNNNPPFETSSGFSRFVQKATGFTWLTKTVAKQAAKKEISKYSDHERLKITIKPYSGTDLIKGKAKLVHIKAKNLVIEDTFTIRDVVVHSNSQTPPWVDLKTGKAKTDVDGDFMVRLTDEDINQALASPDVAQALSDIRIKFGDTGEQHIHVANVRTHFVGTRLNVKADVGLFDQHGKVNSTIPLEIETGFVPDEGRNLLKFKDVVVRTIPEVEDTSPIAQFIEENGHLALKPYKWLKPTLGNVTLSAIKIRPEAMVLQGDFHLNKQS